MLQRRPKQQQRPLRCRFSELPGGRALLRAQRLDRATRDRRLRGGRFSMVDVQNATLAGGVAIGRVGGEGLYAGTVLAAAG